MSKEAKKASLSIRKYGDPILRRRAQEISRVDKKIRELASQMLETLKDAKGIALAANQVGEELRLIVVDYQSVKTDAPPLILINPVMLESRGEQSEEEGCLSIPGTFAHVTRPLEIKVRGMDLNEKEIVVQAEGVLSRVLAHEIDHLDGILFIDHLSSIKRSLLSRKLRKIAAS
ncbi:MAG: peptide deformylase [Candidatus Zixiibacteriota bacterium]